VCVGQSLILLPIHLPLGGGDIPATTTATSGGPPPPPLPPLIGGRVESESELRISRYSTVSSLREQLVALCDIPAAELVISAVASGADLKDPQASLDSHAIDLSRGVVVSRGTVLRVDQSWLELLHLPAGDAAAQAAVRPEPLARVVCCQAQTLREMLLGASADWPLTHPALGMTTVLADGDAATTRIRARALRRDGRLGRICPHLEPLPQEVRAL
jgi:hypothetical protein